jgi:hypothetical protein
MGSPGQDLLGMDRAARAFFGWIVTGAEARGRCEIEPDPGQAPVDSLCSRRCGKQQHQIIQDGDVIGI